MIDALGRTVKSFENIDGNFAMPVSEVKPGLYLVAILSGGHWEVIRIVKE
jgi:hypothetical protein